MKRTQYKSLYKSQKVRSIKILKYYYYRLLFVSRTKETLKYEVTQKKISVEQSADPLNFLLQKKKKKSLAEFSSKQLNRPNFVTK